MVKQFHRMMVLAVLSLVASGAIAAESETTSWDGLVRVKAKRFGVAELLPGTDFNPYTKVMLDETQVSFHKDWMKDINRRRSVDGGGPATRASNKADFGAQFRSWAKLAVEGLEELKSGVDGCERIDRAGRSSQLKVA